MFKEPSEAGSQKIIFEDDRLEKLDQLSRKELEALEQAISAERKQKIEPLERLSEEYFQQWEAASKDADQLRLRTDALMDQIHQFLKDMEDEKKNGYYASIDQMGREVKSLVDMANEAMDDDERLFEIFRKIQGKIHQVDELYFQLELKVGKVREEKEAELMREFESMKQEDLDRPWEDDDDRI